MKAKANLKDCIQRLRDSIEADSDLGYLDDVSAKTVEVPKLTKIQNRD